MKIDLVYNASQKTNRKQWAIANPGYWKRYRNRNFGKAERNRVLQAIRNRKARSKNSDTKMPTPLIAKMDVPKFDNFLSVSKAKGLKDEMLAAKVIYATHVDRTPFLRHPERLQV